ncbi:hypothetical protein RRK58_000494 [Vibrio fluvialis]|nr:hypothetical protein [Vibrio fluvialis]
MFLSDSDYRFILNSDVRYRKKIKNLPFQCVNYFDFILYTATTGDISDIPINGKGSPKAGKLVMDSATFGLSREIGNASFLGGKGKIAG